MPKKQLTEEQRKALGERLKLARAAKAEKAKQSPSQVAPEPKEQILSHEDIGSLIKRLEELEKREFMRNLPQQQTPQVSPHGSLIGTFEKYILDPKHYPDPRERLADEPRLRRFAFKENYELEWLIESTRYETKDRINTVEPKFTLELNYVIHDEDTGEKTNGRYTLRRAIFHEDPQAAIFVARENGIEVDESNEKAFLDEMRYLRMRDWLLGVFYQPKPQPKKNKKDMVIGGKLVEYFEINSQDSETIPFAQLKNKV